MQMSKQPMISGYGEKKSLKMTDVRRLTQQGDITSHIPLSRVS
jgi:hypothetical protein